MRFLIGRPAARLAAAALLPFACAATAAPAEAAGAHAAAPAEAASRHAAAAPAEAASAHAAPAPAEAPNQHAAATSGEAASRHAAATSAEAGGRHVIPGNGRFVAGRDFAPGMYRSGGNEQNCRWQRSRAGKGIVAGGISPGLQIITVQRGEIFTTARCNRWTRIG